MKVIFSRKGVDSSSGGFASPLFGDGSILSVPIPDPRSLVTYGELQTQTDLDVGKLVGNLSGGSINRKSRVHLDPDLDAVSIPRAEQWRPLFGQCGAAQSHLDKLGVEAGDLFIFFGWFKQVEMVRRKWRFVPAAPDLHVIYGWLQVDRVIRVADLSELTEGPTTGLSTGPGKGVSKGASNSAEKNDTDSWLHYHPHCHGTFSGANTIYLSTRRLKLPGVKRSALSGAGVFSNYAACRQLTAAGRSRSIWSVPEWMYPQGRASTLSYHSDPSRWVKKGQATELRSVARGQEFVLDLDHYPEATGWLRGLWADQSNR